MERRLRPWTLGPEFAFQWLPIPSNVPVMNDDVAAVQTVRRRYGMKDGLLNRPLWNLWPSSCIVAGAYLFGAGPAFDRAHDIANGNRQRSFSPGTPAEETGTGLANPSYGGLTPEDLSSHVAACDVLIQPYLDGVSTRRTSFMAGLAHGRAIVTNHGRATEPLWATNWSRGTGANRRPEHLREAGERNCAGTRTNAHEWEIRPENFIRSVSTSLILSPRFQQADEREPAWRILIATMAPNLVGGTEKYLQV